MREFMGEDAAEGDSEPPGFGAAAAALRSLPVCRVARAKGERSAESPLGGPQRQEDGPALALRADRYPDSLWRDVPAIRELRIERCRNHGRSAAADETEPDLASAEGADYFLFELVAGLRGEQVVRVVEPHPERFRPGDRRHPLPENEGPRRGSGGVRGGEEDSAEEKGPETNAHVSGNEAFAGGFGIRGEFKELRGSSGFRIQRAGAHPDPAAF